jgi:hypothetical protein
MAGTDTEVGLETAMVAVGYDDVVLRADEAMRVYDARRHNPDRRPEWRLYYRAGGDVEHLLTEVVTTGDTLVLATPRSGPDLVMIVARAGTAWTGIVTALFPTDGASERLFALDGDVLADAEDASPLMLVLEELGLTPASDQPLLDWVLAQPELAGGLVGLDSFPTTREVAGLAVRRLGAAVDGLPIDRRLMARLDTETEIFYAIESAIALPLFKACTTTAQYVDLAKSLTQRRASRRGRSFEIHLEDLFAEEALTFAPQASLPSGDRIDFLFPSVEDYLDDRVDDSLLFAANAKTTVRERWRQLAGEASRLSTMYLITLDPNLTERAVEQMVDAGVRLVIVDDVLRAFPRPIRDVAINVAEFVGLVRATQPTVTV